MLSFRKHPSMAPCIQQTLTDVQQPLPNGDDPPRLSTHPGPTLVRLDYSVPTWALSAGKGHVKRMLLLLRCHRGAAAVTPPMKGVACVGC